MVMRNLEFGWFIPTRGDTDDHGEPLKIAAGLEMFDRVALAAERAGFEYMLVPVGHQCWDAWMTGAMMTRKTTKLRILVAARPSYINPVLLAKMVSTFDQLSEGRISINLIAGQSETENIAEGVHWSKEQRNEIMDEEVSILKALWTQTAPTDWHGKYYTLKKAELLPKPYQKPYPKFYLGGVRGRRRSYPPNIPTCICFGATPPSKSPATLRRCAGWRANTAASATWVSACACRSSAARTRRMLGRLPMP
jgi:alkanesulfonate monooxygenase